MDTLETLRYPVGRFVKPTVFDRAAIQTIIDFPAALRREVAHLSESQLNTPYRPEGWTVRQVVHHCADSHTNAFMRFKWALTEDKPTIKPYEEALWAALADSKNMPIEPSLMMLEGLHQRWAAILHSLTDSDLEKTFIHPAQQREVPLKEAIAMYAWHSAHHLAHITSLKKREAWT